MTIEERLRRLILARYPSMKDFAAECGINYSTILAVFSRGLENTGISNVRKICAELGITVDGLASGQIVFVKKTPDHLQTLREYQTRFLGLMEEQKLTLDGVPLSQEEALLLDDQITAATEMIRRRRDREARQ